ncbi:MAG TPA: hypothetical protein VFT87_00740 [Candidatus Saccharimonadales bacterium]|nr:hypothetical protein [Candidatus Saccharimonadales bacterium]
MDKFLGFIGNMFGGGVYSLVWAAIGLELVLSPIFIISLAHQFGIEISAPWNGFSFWIVAALSVAMTGTQYALNREGVDRKSIGARLALGFAVVDTANDGGGLLALIEGGIANPDSSNLVLGMFPRWDPSNWQASLMKWTAYVVVCAACFYHERYLRMMLSRTSWELPEEANSYEVNFYKWMWRAGDHFNKFVDFCTMATPFICLLFDFVLMPVSQTGDEGVLGPYMSWPIAFFIMMLTMVTWQKYKDLKRAGYRLSQLPVRYPVIIIAGLVLTTADSLFDLMGFNKLVFGQYTPIPKGLNLPMFMTLAMIMLLCTTFEIMNSDMHMKFAVKRRTHPVTESADPTDPTMGGMDGTAGPSSPSTPPDYWR